MAFTRFHDDPARLAKYAEETSYAGRYYLNTPGQGVNLPFLEDPNIRLQGWGANLTNNTVNLESDLRGLTRPLCHDVIEVNQYNVHAVPTVPYMYRNAPSFVEESRASHPAFMYRDLEQVRWEHPWINPLANIERNFEHNIQTRILQKDAFVPIIR